MAERIFSAKNSLDESCDHMPCANNCWWSCCSFAENTRNSVAAHGRGARGLAPASIEHHISAVACWQEERSCLRTPRLCSRQYGCMRHEGGNITQHDSGEGPRCKHQVATIQLSLLSVNPLPASFSVLSQRCKIPFTRQYTAVQWPT